MRPLDWLCTPLLRGPLPPTAVTGIAHDSRKVQPGNVFVAIPGFRSDGTAYIPDALARGAMAVVAERSLKGPWTEQVPIIHVPNARKAMAVLADRFYGNPSDRLSVIGVTGTTGKTTVALMIDHLLADAAPTGLIGSLHIRTGERLMPARHTTPESAETQRLFHEMVSSGVRFATMEVSSHGIALHRVTSIRFAVAAVTNINPEHLDFHGSFEEYVATKESFVARASQNAILVLNVDDERVAGMARLAGREVVRVGTSDDRSSDGSIESNLRLQPIQFDETGTLCRLTIRPGIPRLDAKVESGRSDVFDVGLPTLGRHNVSNAAVALGVALVCGMSAQAAVRRLESFRPPRRRLEVIQREPYVVVDDTTGVPESFDAVFEAVEPIAAGRRVIIVYALRGGRGEGINRLNAARLAKWEQVAQPARFIVTSSASHTDEANRVRPEEEEAFLSAAKHQGLRLQHYEELTDAVHAAVASALEGDLILLLGAQGMDKGAELIRRALAARTSAPDSLDYEIPVAPR